MCNSKFLKSLQLPLGSLARVQPLPPSSSAPLRPPALLTPPLKIQRLRREEPNEILIYTDASHRDGTSSAGIYSCGVESISRSLRLQPGLTSVEAEREALLLGIAIGSRIARRAEREVVTVCGDCIPALQDVAKLIYEGKLKGVSAKVKVKVEWVKAHSGVKGNVSAHKLARKG
ncbi:hypothetical protein B9Z19DRAFT_1100334 [Tuber borchii]|uniref:RNase H type-1 domain-containing protein n=1 Tax=Tuber borchii TaxID=42251 RepID=A0A2T6ZXV9_TUBBO|nr:hypothetical protein B9Z19DRAFT_1100334 [Tuber borchii]